jgi:membrane-associated protein
MSPRVICVAILTLQAAYSMALVPATPALLGRDPVLLEALQGSLPAMAAGGAFARVGEASLALALLAPLPTLMMADPFLWWAGRLWGPKIARYLGGRGRFGGRRTDRAVGLLDRYGAWAVIVSRVLPVPSALIYAAAGWNGMRLRRFLLLDLAGAALWVVPIVGLGYAIGHPAVDLAREITHYGLLLGLAIGVAALGVGAAKSLAGTVHPKQTRGAGRNARLR